MPGIVQIALSKRFHKKITKEYDIQICMFLDDELGN